MLKIILLAWASNAMISHTTVQVDPIDYYNSARSFVQIGKFAQALQVINKAIALDSHNVEFFVTQSHVLDKLQRYPQAIKAVDKALRLIPCHRAGLKNRMIFSARMFDTKEYIKSYKMFIRHHHLDADEDIFKLAYEQLINKGE